MDFKKHIAGSGKKAGQWVTCLASDSPCPLGGAHVSEDKLKEVQKWAGRRAFTDLNKQDYIDYQKSERAGTLEEDSKPMETLEAKRARLGDADLVVKPKKKQPGTALREAEQDARALKDKVSEEKYYNTLFRGYPEVVNSDLKTKKLLAEYLEAKHGPWSENARYVDRVADLKASIANRLNEPGAVKRDRDYWVKKNAEDKAYYSVAYVQATEAEKEAKMRAKMAYAGLNEKRSRVSNRTQPQKRIAPVVSNQIADYVPLNDGSPSEKAMLERLQKFEGDRGAFGKISRETRILEKMVHNQVVLSGESGDPEPVIFSIKEYGSNVDVQISHARDNIEMIAKYDVGTGTRRNKSLKELEEKIDTHIRTQARQNDMKQSIHDSYVTASKKELLHELFKKGHHDTSEYSLQIGDATKASEIYSLRNLIGRLKKQDEFEAAGL